MEEQLTPNQESERPPDIAMQVAALLVAGVTRCGNVLPNRQSCNAVHGAVQRSPVDGSPSPIRFTRAIVVEGLIKPVCDVCWAVFLQKTAMTIEEAVLVQRRQLRELEERLARGRAQAGIVPAGSAEPAARPQQAETPKVARPQAPAAARQETPHAPKPPQSGREAEKRDKHRRGGKKVQRRSAGLAKAVEQHLELLRKENNFEKLFEQQGRELCSLRCGCGQGSGTAFVTRPYKHLEERFALCNAGRSAALQHWSKLLADGQRAPYLVFRDEKDWERFADRQRAHDEVDATRAKAILERRFADDSTERCKLLGCERPGKPKAWIRLPMDGFDADYGICADCHRAARRLLHHLHEEAQQAGTRPEIPFRVITDPGDTRPAPRPSDRPHRGRPRHRELPPKPGKPVAAPKRPKPSSAPAYTPKGTLGEQLAAKIVTGEITATPKPSSEDDVGNS